MDNTNYTYEDVKRERVQLLLENFMFEMIDQNDYGWTEEDRPMPDEEIKAMISDYLASLDDTQFKSVTDKLVNSVFDAM